MKIEFKFLPILVTSYPVGTKAKVPKECVVFPCFKCKNYVRSKFVKEDVFIVDVEYMPLGFKLEDGCTVDPGFTNIKYNEEGKAICPNFSTDFGMGRKL